MSGATLGSNIRYFRERKRFSQLHVARELDVSPASVSQWEADINIPRDPTLRRLAGLLGITPGRLVDGPTRKRRAA